MAEPCIVAIDFGTSFTSAAMSTGSAPQVLELPPDGTRRIPSAVALDDVGNWVVGKRALADALLAPDRVERTPKRVLGQQVLLAGRSINSVDLVAEVYKVVMIEARRMRGGRNPDQVRLTHPAGWLDDLRYLREAASGAGIPAPDFVPEPVAAARYLVSDAPVREGGLVAVYDLGGGTFDTAVLRRAGGSFVLHGQPGGRQLGGEDIDDLLYRFLGDHLPAADWDQLQNSAADDWGDARRAFRQQVRDAKEVLSGDNYVDIPLLRPVAQRSVRLTREELEKQIRPMLEETVELLAETVEAAGVKLDDLEAIYLTGGSSRIPLVSRLIREGIRREPSTWSDPKTVVALGAALAGGDSRPEPAKASVTAKVGEKVLLPRVSLAVSEAGRVFVLRLGDRSKWELVRWNPETESAEAVAPLGALPAELKGQPRLASSPSMVALLANDRLHLFDLDLQLRHEQDFATPFFIAVGPNVGWIWHHPERILKTGFDTLSAAVRLSRFRLTPKAGTDVDINPGDNHLSPKGPPFDLSRVDADGTRIVAIVSMAQPSVGSMFRGRLKAFQRVVLLRPDDPAGWGEDFTDDHTAAPWISQIRGLGATTLMATTAGLQIDGKSVLGGIGNFQWFVTRHGAFAASTFADVTHLYGLVDGELRLVNRYPGPVLATQDDETSICFAFGQTIIVRFPLASGEEASAVQRRQKSVPLGAWNGMLYCVEGEAPNRALVRFPLS